MVTARSVALEALAACERQGAWSDGYLKKAIGAFWGMVFKFVLGYRDQESVSISLNQRFFVRTATCFQNPVQSVKLEG